MNLFSCKKYTEWIDKLRQENNNLDDLLSGDDAEAMLSKQVEIDLLLDQSRGPEFFGLEIKHRFENRSTGDMTTFSDGSIAFTGDDCAICVADPKTGQILRKLEGKEWTFAGKTYKSLDLRTICELGYGFILAGGGDAKIFIWGPDGKFDESPQVVTNTIYSIIYSDDLGYYFTGESHTGKVRVWDVNAKGKSIQESNIYTLQTTSESEEELDNRRRKGDFSGDPGSVQSLAYLGDGIIAGCGAGTCLNFWNVNDRDSILPFTKIEKLHSPGGGKLLKTSDGTLIYYCFGIYVIDTVNYKISKSFSKNTGWIGSLAEVSPGVLAATDDDTITFWNKDKGIRLGAMKVDRPVSEITALPGGGFAVAGRDMVEVFDRI